MRGCRVILYLVMAVAAGPVAAAHPTSTCDSCVDGPEMQRPAIAGDTSPSIRQFTPAEVEAGAPCLAAMTQTEMTMCQGNVAAQATSRLSAALSAYRQRLNSKQLAQFDASQSAWEAFLVSACEFQASGVEGGTAYSMVVSQCFEALTNNRLRAVEDLAGCEEGDLACPVHP